MYYSNCGNTLSQGGLFCDRCGEDMRAYTASVESETVSKPLAPDMQTADKKAPIPEEKEKIRRKKRKKSPWIKLLIVFVVLFMSFNVAKAVVFFIDYKDYIFVSTEDCGMRDKDELIDSFVEGIVDDNDSACYRLSVYPLILDEIFKEEMEESTLSDRLVITRVGMKSTCNYGDFIKEELGGEDFKTTYYFDETESLDIDELILDLTDYGIEEDDIEKAEKYIIKVNCSSGEKTVVLDVELELVRISRTWYVANHNIRVAFDF